MQKRYEHYASFFLGAGLALTSTFLFLRSGYSEAVVVSFALTLLICFFSSLKQGSYPSRIKAGNLLLIVALLYMSLKGVAYYFLGFGSINDVVYSTSQLVFCSALLIFFRDNGERILYTYSLLMFITGICLGLIINFGVHINILPNMIAASLVPLCLYCVYKKSPFYLLFLTATIAYCLYFSARGALLTIIIFYVLLTIASKNVGLAKLCFFILFLSLSVFTFYAALYNPEVLNKMMTYRPVIWNYYLHEAFSSPIFGHGYTGSQASSEAALAYSNYVGRGVAPEYGPHSMYIRYFYEAGLVGLLLIFSAVVCTMKKRLNFGWFLLGSYLISSFFSSNLFGHPALYSVIMTIAFIICNKDVSIPTRRTLYK